MKEYEWMNSIEFAISVALLGMILHFMKKKVRGETATAVTRYFKDHFKSTFSAVVATIIGATAVYFQLSTGEFIDILAYFGTGYTFDSMFNKWDNGELQ